jgi:hypothetical protein
MFRTIELCVGRYDQGLWKSGRDEVRGEACLTQTRPGRESERRDKGGGTKSNNN